jgi:glycosyltransferase involved in cell wall biosynthesis
MIIFVDPIYYHNNRGIGVVTRNIAKQIQSECVGPSLLQKKTANMILKNSIMYLIWEQIILPIILWRIRPDYFFATGGTSPYFIPSSVKQILWVHDVLFLEETRVPRRAYTIRQKLGRIYRKFIFYRCIDNSHKIVAISHFTLARLKSKMKIDKPLSVIQNFVEPPKRLPTIEEKEDICVIFTSYAVNKGANFVNQALGLSNRVKDELRIVVLGIDAPANTHYHNVQYYRNLTDSKLSHLMDRARYCVIPSNYEGFGLPIAEAVFHNCIPISSDIPIFKELNPHFCEIKLDNPMSLWNAIFRYSENPYTYQHLDNTRSKFLNFNEAFNRKIWKLLEQ